MGHVSSAVLTTLKYSNCLQLMECRAGGHGLDLV